MTADEIRKSREVLFRLRELLHRCVMHDALKTHDTELNFFRIYQGSLLDTVCVDWCKFFGNYKSEESHWRNLLKKAEYDAFRTKIDEQLFDRNLGSLIDCRDSIMAYRNKAAAHLDFDENERPECYPSVKAVKVTAELLYQELYSRLQQEEAHHGHVDPCQITGDAREEIVAHNAELFSACLDALHNWDNKPRAKSATPIPRDT